MNHQGSLLDDWQPDLRIVCRDDAAAVDYHGTTFSKVGVTTPLFWSCLVAAAMIIF